MKRAFLSFILLAVTLLLSAQTLEGPYSGVLDVMGQMKLNITLHISGNQCTMDVLEQGKIALETEKMTKDSIIVQSKALGIHYVGAVKGDEITGTFMQNGLALPLNLKKGEAKISRPQEPPQPLLYITEEVSFTNPVDGTILSGTLTYPIGWGYMKKTCPVVLLVTGSGLQDRDEQIFHHRPFFVLADRLAKSGIASLRYDDRGFGKSTGEVKDATTETFALDAKAGVEYLRSCKKFTQVGILGHSEGGSISFMLGAQKIADFIVSMAGPAVPGIEISMEQNRQLLAAMGRQETVSEEKIREEAKKTPSAWMDFFFDYNPANDIKNCICPVMAINGTLDMQVNKAQNLDKIKELLPDNKKNLCKEYEGLNHLFQHAKTGMPTEYGQIEETMSEEVMNDIAKWINSL